MSRIECVHGKLLLNVDCERVLSAFLFNSIKKPFCFTPELHLNPERSDARIRGPYYTFVKTGINIETLLNIYKQRYGNLSLCSSPWGNNCQHHHQH